MSGRTIWFSQDAARHRRGLMVELQDEFGPVALAVDTVLCSHAKMQNDGGAIREGFAAIAREAGMSGRGDEVRAFMDRAAAIGWLDDLDVDDDGRRFRVRVSGWRADQDRAGAAFRKQAQREREAVTDRDMSRDVTECPPTGQDRTGQDLDSPNPAGGDGAVHNPSAGARATATDEFDFEELADHVRGILQRGVDGLTTSEGCKRPTVDAVLAELRTHAPAWDRAVAAAVEARSIAQSQDRAPNIVALYAQRLSRQTERTTA